MKLTWKAYNFAPCGRSKNEGYTHINHLKLYIPPQLKDVFEQGAPRCHLASNSRFFNSWTVSCMTACFLVFKLNLTALFMITVTHFRACISNLRKRAGKPCVVTFNIDFLIFIIIKNNDLRIIRQQDNCAASEIRNDSLHRNSSCHHHKSTSLPNIALAGRRGLFLGCEQVAQESQRTLMGERRWRSERRHQSQRSARQSEDRGCSQDPTASASVPLPTCENRWSQKPNTTTIRSVTTTTAAKNTYTEKLEPRCTNFPDTKMECGKSIQSKDVLGAIGSNRHSGICTNNCKIWTWLFE